MDKINRIFRLHAILKARRTPISLAALKDQLECSERSVRRTIDELKIRLGAPIEYDRDKNGYSYDNKSAPLYELPGVWFSPDELYALLVSHRLLAEVQPGLLEHYIAPLNERLESLLSEDDLGSPELIDRVRILQVAARETNVKDFRHVTSALLKRRQIRVLYHGRERDQTTERIVSPQRMVYYRSNWYVDAWCHLRQQLRSFSLDRLHLIETLNDSAKEIPSAELDAELSSGYGIFAGPPVATAKLQFSSSAARWVADEQWHPDQSGEVLSDGRYILSVPYSDSRELARDILKYGAEVEVISPAELREQVRTILVQAVNKYEK